MKIEFDLWILLVKKKQKEKTRSCE